MTWQCRRCGRTVDLVLRDGDRCAACAMRTRAGRTLPDDDGAADPPVDGWDVIRMRKLLQPSSSSAGDAGAQDAMLAMSTQSAPHCGPVPGIGTFHGDS